MMSNDKIVNRISTIIVMLLLLPAFACAEDLFFDGNKKISTEQKICIESSRNIDGILVVNLHFAKPTSGTLYINGKIWTVFENKSSIGGNHTLKSGKYILKIKVHHPTTLTRLYGYNGVLFCGFYPTDPLEEIKKTINSLSIKQKKELLKWLKEDIEKKV